MIFGIGTDIVDRGRIAALLQKFPEAFPQRILTPQEQVAFQQAGQPAAFLAKRFAAKEACLKALGTGMIKGLSWQQIEVGHLPSGQPMVVLSGGCHQRLQEACTVHGATATYKVHLTIADEATTAIAFVMIDIQE